MNISRSKITAHNIGAIASSCAFDAFAKGERWGGAGNSTTYPRKWYSKIEAMFGPLDAAQLSYFSAVYEFNLAQLTTGRIMDPPKLPDW